MVPGFYVKPDFHFSGDTLMNITNPNTSRKPILIVAIMIPIALLHFITGSQYQGPFPTFVNGYLIDILLPFGFYFLLCLSDNGVLNSWIVKALLIFVACTAVEIAQYYGVPLLGQTFDPWDFVMYGFGVLLAVLCDTIFFPRIFSFWQADSRSNQPESIKDGGIFTWRQN